MDTLSRIFNDITSWYWWLSVVVVGLAINLASAYLKPALDARLARSSGKRHAERQARTEKFEKEVASIAADPTLLILEAQRAAHAEVKVFLLSSLIGVHLVLLFILATQPEPRSLITSVLLLVLAVISLPIHMTSWFSAMRNEIQSTDRYRAAKARYRSEA